MRAWPLLALRIQDRKRVLIELRDVLAAYPNLHAQLDEYENGMSSLKESTRENREGLSVKYARETEQIEDPHARFLRHTALRQLVAPFHEWTLFQLARNIDKIADPELQALELVALRKANFLRREVVNSALLAKSDGITEPKIRAHEYNALRVALDAAHE